jgi:hypothetical protein
LPLFRDVLMVCQEMDFLGGTFFALDGVKLPSNASQVCLLTKVVFRILVIPGLSLIINEVSCNQLTS